MKRIFVCCFLFCVCATGFSQNQFSRYDVYIASTFDQLNNKTFVEIELEDASGQMINTGSLHGKTIYVDFWFTTCPPCIKQIPSAKTLHNYFAADTNVVFLNICIDNIERKQDWKQMIREREMPGIQLFYARNRPQKINLLREYKITFPTYLLVNKQMKVIGYNAPRPSEEGLVHWVIKKAKEDLLLSSAFKLARTGAEEYKQFINDFQISKNATAD